MKLAQVVKGFLDIDTANQYADRMESMKENMQFDDGQCRNSWATYGANWDLLEDSLEKMESITGLELIPTYDYCRIYSVGETLEKHSDRPACQVSVTVCLRNEKSPWEFHWDGGSYAMEQGDAVVYHRPLIHWRDSNPDGMVYQSFLHYVDANGPHSDCGNEYLKGAKKHNK